MSSMNTSLLRSPGLYISIASAILGLLVSQGVLTSGSGIDQVLGYLIAIGGVLTGHGVAAPSTTAMVK